MGLNCIHRVPGFTLFVDTCVSMLYQTIEDHVLFLVDGHIPFKVPASGFTMISHCVKFVFSLGSHVVNIVWSQIVVDQGKVGCPTILSSQERFDVGPASMLPTDFSLFVKQGMVVHKECWVVGRCCHWKVMWCPLNHLVQVVIPIGFSPSICLSVLFCQILQNLASMIKFVCICTGSLDG